MLNNYTLFNASLHGPSLVHFSDHQHSWSCRWQQQVVTLHHSLPLKTCWSYETKLRLCIIINKKLRINGQESIGHIDFKQQTYAFTCSNSAQRHPQFQTTITSLWSWPNICWHWESVSFSGCLLASFHWTGLLQRAGTRVPGLLPLDKEQRALATGEGNQRKKTGWETRGCEGQMSSEARYNCTELGNVDNSLS